MQPAYSDPELLQITLDLSKKFNLTTFFETGTYHGDTSKILSKYFDQVITVENNPEFYQVALDNLKEITNCKLVLGNSPEVMEQYLEQDNSSIFFFLDAHWEHYWPLLDELKIIKEKNLKPIIAIHDFFSPDENGDPKFGFDSYHGQPLDFNYIKSSIENIYGEKYEIKYNTSSTTNSGVIYIFPKQK
jgi:predicted O-methyltransferase YrrM